MRIDVRKDSLEKSHIHSQKDMNFTWSFCTEVTESNYDDLLALIGDRDCENFPIVEAVSKRQCNDICIDTPYC